MSWHKVRRWIWRRRFQLLLTSTVAFYVGLPLLDQITALAFVRDILYQALLLSVVYALAGSRRLLWVMILLGASLLVMVYLAPQPSDTVLWLRFIAASAFFGTACWSLGKFVLVDGPVTSERISAAVSLYVLIGVLWAVAYAFLYTLDESSFSISAAHTGDIQGLEVSMRGPGFPLFLYYSFVTLTTLGYGDMTPASRPAMALSTAEALFGQIYLAVLIARLVGLYIAERGRKEDP